MADADKTIKPSTAPESPTTAREMDFEDELQDTAPTSSNPPQTNTTPAPASAPASYEAPAKPPRPLSPQQQAEKTLKEAFPTIDATVVKAVLTASGGQVEPAFNALLGMSDPDSQKEAPPPAQPPRPVYTAPAPTSTTRSQLEADELYARQLAEHYSGAGTYGGGDQRRTSSGRGGRDPQAPRQRQETGLKPNELNEDDHSFFNDDLPVIRENIRQGFIETQTKVNSWVAALKKKIDGEEEPDFSSHARPDQRYQPQQYAPRRSGEGRRSADRERYDADPQVLGDDFSALELRDAEAPPPKPNRPLANPNLFKPTPPAPTDRRVSFQDGPPEEIGSSTGGSLYRSSPPPGSTRPPPTPGATKGSKWQPLSTIDPSPVADNDPFSLGDSDEEKETKTTKDSGKAEGDKPNDDEGERLRKAAKEAMEDEIGSTEGKKKTT